MAIYENTLALPRVYSLINAAVTPIGRWRLPPYWPRPTIRAARWF